MDVCVYSGGTQLKSLHEVGVFPKDAMAFVLHLKRFNTTVLCVFSDFIRQLCCLRQGSEEFPLKIGKTFCIFTVCVCT